MPSGSRSTDNITKDLTSPLVACAHGSCWHFANVPFDRRQLESEGSRKRFEASAPYFQLVMADTRCPPVTGANFARARSWLAVYSHIVRLSSDQVPPGPLEPLIAETREKYDELLEIEEEPHDVRHY